MADSSKKMSLMGLTTLVTVNMMGSGIIMLPTSMAQLGAVSLLSWIVTAIGSMSIAYCFSQCGIFCPRPGGLSAYTEEAHAKSGFFLCSYLYFLSLAIANVAVAISAVGYMTSLLPWLGNFRLLVDTALSDMYRSGEIEQAFDKYLGGADDTAKKLFKVYALPQ